MKSLLTSFCLLSMMTLGGNQVEAATFTFNTFDGEFDFRVENQGWWSETLSNSTGNTNYYTGEFHSEAAVDLLRSFFTFDLSTLDLSGQTLVSATFQAVRYIYASRDASETVAFFDVSTPADVLNNNTGVSSEIFTDLGSGTSYGSFVVPDYASSNTELLVFPLNTAALADIAASTGGFFSIGGSLQDITPGDGEREAIFSASIGDGAQQLVIETRPMSVPEVGTSFLIAVGLIGTFVRRK